MTRRDNLIALLAGETPQWTPCSINFQQWFDHHRAFDTLPDELAGVDDYVGAMKALGSDIFSRNIDAGYRERFDGVEIEQVEEPGPTGPLRTTIYRTPHGELRTSVQEQTSQTTSYVVEDPVKDWSRDGQAYLWLLEHLVVEWDRDAFARIDAQIGDDGVVLMPFARSPLKQLHRWFGLDGGCLFVMDEPQAAKTCCELYWSKVRPVLRDMAGEPRLHAACLMDNVDAPFYSPGLCRDYWTPYVREAAALFEQNGKRLFVHACGKLHALIDVFREAGVHGLEGMAHPPIGDFTIDDVRSMPDQFIYNGGFSASEQVTKSDKQVRDFYRRFFADMDGLPRFIFGAACQTTVQTPWQRIKLAIEQCRRYRGG